jgi:hypothetical protein
MSGDDNTWGTLSGSGWSVAGSAQYPQHLGSQTSITAAYNVVTSPGTTNNVSQNQATLGGDAGITCILAFYERDADFTSVPTADVFWDAENSTNGTTMTTAIMDAGTHLSSAAGSWVFVGSAANLDGQHQRAEGLRHSPGDGRFDALHGLVWHARHAAGPQRAGRHRQVFRVGEDRGI